LANAIQYVFVLMLENRSFDHMLGFSGITGTDAFSGGHTEIIGLIDVRLLQFAKSFAVSGVSGIVQRKEQPWPPPPTVSVRDLFRSNQFTGQTYRAAPPAGYAMAVGPGHEFSDVLLQLCGADGENAYLAAAATFRASGGAPPAYPQVNNTGFVASFEAEIANSGLGGQSPGDVMQCYNNQSLLPDQRQLPVLSTLAQEFVVCDNWFASLPGPTWPNRFFAHAASSGGLDHSPTDADMVWWEKVSGFGFKNGTIFDVLNANNISWRIYAGDEFPIVSGLQGVHFTDIHDYADFAGDVAQPGYSVSYTFIEPSYGHFWSDYKCGTSQHPLDDVTRGEALIKATYEAIRNSPVWGSSMMIITWDEHGGFFDHVPPPPAVAPGDTAPGDQYNLYGFGFNQYGPRVPAVVISPLIPRNFIDHRTYDHASIPASLEACFGLPALTQRDANANNLMSLVSLSSPRGDAPMVLPNPAQSGLTDCDPVSFKRIVATTASSAAAGLDVTQIPRPLDSINEGNLPGFLLAALRADLALSPPAQGPAIMAQFSAIKTRADAALYVSGVQPKVRAARSSLSP
jgi:phospholipase C